METFSALLAICAGISPAPGEFPTQRPVTRSIDVFFDLRPNKRLSKQTRGWWFETLSCSLWRHCSVQCCIKGRVLRKNGKSWHMYWEGEPATRLDIWNKYQKRFSVYIAISSSGIHLLQTYLVFISNTFILDKNYSIQTLIFLGHLNHIHVLSLNFTRGLRLMYYFCTCV